MPAPDLKDPERAQFLLHLETRTDLALAEYSHSEARGFDDSFRELGKGYRERRYRSWRKRDNKEKNRIPTLCL